MALNILVADDDAVFRRLLCDIIKKQRYEVFEASNGKEAIDVFFGRTNISLVVLDVMMPIYDGWEVLNEIRSKSDIPVLMLTALGSENCEIKGLSNGADDYLTKPFSYEVLVARINALLRKAKKDIVQSINIRDIHIDQSCHKVFIDNDEILLNNKEYNLLLYLIKNKQIVLSREKILYGVWGYDYNGDIRTIDAHIKMLRSKLKHCSNYIKTIRGSGYIFEVENEKVD